MVIAGYRTRGTPAAESDTHSRLQRSRSNRMTSHDDRDNILTDQKLHDLLKVEDEMDRLAGLKRDLPVEPGRIRVEDPQAPSS